MFFIHDYEKEDTDLVVPAGRRGRRRLGRRHLQRLSLAAKKISSFPATGGKTANKHRFKPMPLMVIF